MLSFCRDILSSHKRSYLYPCHHTLPRLSYMGTFEGANMSIQTSLLGYALMSATLTQYVHRITSYVGSAYSVTLTYTLLSYTTYIILYYLYYIILYYLYYIILYNLVCTHCSTNVHTLLALHCTSEASKNRDVTPVCFALSEHQHMPN